MAPVINLSIVCGDAAAEYSTTPLLLSSSSSFLDLLLGRVLPSALVWAWLSLDDCDNVYDESNGNDINHNNVQNNGNDIDNIVMIILL